MAHAGIALIACLCFDSGLSLDRRLWQQTESMLVGGRVSAWDTERPLRDCSRFCCIVRGGVRNDHDIYRKS